MKGIFSRGEESGLLSERLKILWAHLTLVLFFLSHLGKPQDLAAVDGYGCF